MLIRAAELNGQRVDVRCSSGHIADIAPSLSSVAGETVLEARGGVLLPGLHDHHIHLYAQAAADASVVCGPPEVTDRQQLADSLGKQPGDGWLRGVAYHESVAGELDRRQLDQWQNQRPVRIQHRSGKMWILNSRAMALLALDDEQHPGIEHDAAGHATGRLFRMDEWLRGRLGQSAAPDIAPLSRKLAAWGVTGITDASAGNSVAEMAQFCRVVEAGELLQRLRVMGNAELPECSHPLVERGALKILLDDHRLPEYAELLALIHEGHRQQRGVAIHCVTRTELVFALTALGEAGGNRGNRIEHASVTPDDALPLMRDAGVTVVTQPGFIYQRGDQYLIDVEPQEHELLYRCRGFLNGGIPLAGSSDAPYGSPDPWLAMRAAVHRHTRKGKTIGAAEALSAEQALALFTGFAHSPGGPLRRVAVGEPADLCLLDRPWSEARTRLSGADVLATVRAGELIYHRKGRE